MRNYEERAKDFIKTIFPLIDNFNNLFTVSRAVDTFNYINKRKVKLCHGIARIALITSDYVVKFDYDPDEVARVGGCDAEVRLYAQAERDGFAYLFAKITPYEYNNRRFYIMPRIYGINPNRFDYANDFMTIEEERWCDAHNLSDLHCNNYGFRNGKLCIIDYACSEYSSSSYTSPSSPFVPFGTYNSITCSPFPSNSST